MAPKSKEKGTKMGLSEFLNDSQFGGSWADEVEEQVGTQPLPSSDRSRMGGSSNAWSSGGGDRFQGYSRQEAAPSKMPTKPPYTAHLGNLPYDANQEAIMDFFAGCNVVSVRIIEDREMQRPKGFAYVEFQELDDLKKALDMDQQSLQGRYVKVRVADPPRESMNRSDSNRDFSDWSRKGPLPDLPGRENNRRRDDFGSGERRGPPRDPMEGDGKVRDFGNWERKGPLSPIPQSAQAPPMSRGGSRRGQHEGGGSSQGERRQSPAAWGEGRQESRGPSREFRPQPERQKTAAELDSQWREKMRPDGPARTSASQSRDGSEAPPSPALSAATPALSSRPKLNLAKRTVSEATDQPSPSATGDAKASPFGAARPIDTATREREIEEKRQQAIKEKREADEKAKEERRLAKEAAAKEAAAKAEEEARAAEKAKEDAAAAAAAGPTEASKEAADTPSKTESAEGTSDRSQNGVSNENRPLRTREPREPKEPRGDVKSRANESRDWRTPSGDHGNQRPRGAPSGPRGGRGGGPPRGPRYGSGGQGRPNGPRGGGDSGSGSQNQAPPTPTTEAAPATPGEDGWTTVTAPRGGRRGQAPRAS